MSFSRRILIVVENLPVPLDRRVWLEARTLRKAGYAVSVICPTGRGHDALFEEIDGIHIYRYVLPHEGHGPLGYVREYGAALLAWLRLSRQIWRERGFDVIHGCNPPDLVFLLAWLYRPFGVRYIFDHHDVCPELFEAKFNRRGLLWRLMQGLEWLTFRTADVVISTNESFAEIARRRGGKKADDVFVVRSGPAIDRFRPGEGNVSYRKGFGHVLGYVGVIGQQEGLDLLVAALDHLVNIMGRRDVHAVIIGFGPHLPVIQADVTARGLDSHVTFTGPLYDNALLDALNAVDIGVSPDPKNAMNNISTMNKVIEYMALAKPLVQFDLTEGRASAGEAALYAAANDPVDFAAKIAWLMDHPEERQRMGALGRQRVIDGLAWKHSVPALLAAYERLFARRAPHEASG